MEPLKILRHSSGLLKVYDMGDDFQIVITKNGFSKEIWFSIYTHADDNAKAERLDYCINVVIDDENLQELIEDITEYYRSNSADFCSDRFSCNDRM